MATISERLSDESRGIDLDIDEVWSQAQEQYESITGMALKATSRGFDAVALDIHERLRLSKVSDRAKAQQIMGNAMKCLQRFGGIVAQATSVVFGPSQQCWNAISFIISAAQGYQAVLDGFAAIMERCIVFLERLNVDLDAKKQSGVAFDTRLRKATYAVIAHFLTALGHSHKVATSKRQKVKTVFKVVLFNDDSGVKDSLGRMETLVRDLTDTKVSVILQDVQGLARYVRESEEEINRNQEVIKAGIARIEAGVERTETTVVQMHLELNKKFSQDLEEKNLAKISKVLGISEHHAWQTGHQHYSNHRIAGTGQWLLQPGILVSSWANIDRAGLKAIALIGPSGHGKSFLTSVIVDHLLERYPKGSSGSQRVSVAYHYAESKNEDTLAKCFGSIIRQFAKTNREYSQAVANICGNPEALSSAEEVWQKLVLDLRHIMQGTHYIVIDGLRAGDDDPKNRTALTSLVNLTTATDGLGDFRLFVSTKTDEPAVASLGCPGIARIALGSDVDRPRPGILRSRSHGNGIKAAGTSSLRSTPNESDLILFTKTRLAAMCERKPYLHATLSNSALDAATTLAKGVKGSYSSLEVKLAQIEASDSVEDVHAVIKQASEDPHELLRRDIQLLNELLSSEEIDELNHLLVWVTGSFQPTTLKMLEAAVGDRSLWLSKHIPQKFYRLLKWDESNDIVEAPRLSEMTQMLQETEETAKVPGAAGKGTMHSSNALSEAEIQLVRRVVNTFCGDELFGKFNFDAFFQSKLGKRNARIRLPSRQTMHSRILNRCLESFREDREDPYFSPLRRYAAAHFVSHLECLDLSSADREELKLVGSMLADLLLDEPSIRSWWKAANENFEQLEEQWILKDDNVRLLKSFLKHPLVSAGYSQDPSKMERLKLITDDNAGAHSVLEAVAKILAKDWYASNYIEGDNEDIYWWAFGIMLKTWNLPWKADTVPGVAEILRFDDWARGLPDMDVSTPHWASRLASTLSIAGHNEQALCKCVEIDLEASDAWPALLKAAEVSRELGKHADALKYLHQIKSDHLGALDEDSRLKKAYWITLLPEEGHNHWSLGDFTEAESCFRKVINENKDQNAVSGHKDSMASLFELWDERRAYKSALDQVKQWVDSANSNDDSKHWFTLLYDSAPFHKCLISTVALLEDSNLICEAYEGALASADPVKDLKKVRELRCNYATVKYHSSSSPIQHNVAFHHWEHVIFTSGDDYDSWEPAPLVNRRMSRRLLDDAIASGLKPILPQASEYADMLENFAGADLPFLQDVRDGNEDPRLPLIRLHFLAGQMEKARELARDRLRSIFDQWPKKESDKSALLHRYAWLGQVFNVIGDDQNAIAAWGLLEPKRPNSTDAEETSAGAEEPDGEQPSGKQDNAPPSRDAVDDTIMPVDGMERTADGKFAKEGDKETTEERSKATMTDPQSEADAQSKADADPDVSENEDLLADLESDIGYWCVNCNFGFKAMADVFICKHCLNLHLCANCHAKLQNDELHILMCSPRHEHLYVPPFERERWEGMDAESMVVGDKIVSRAHWLDGLRVQWGLKQESIDAHKSQMAAQVQAAKVLTRWRRGLLKLRTVSAVTK